MISYVNQAAEILENLFNISKREAYALSLFGLGDVIENDMNDIFKMIPQEIINKMDLLNEYGLTLQEIDNIAFNYYKGIKGTSCNE